MHVESPASPVSRLRATAVSPERFRQIAIATAGMLLVIVATGATVRLTASGLGCQHWPGCQPGDPFPRKGYHSYVEFANRVVAFVTIVVTLVAAVASLLVAGLPRRVKWLAWGVFAGTFAQAPLGAITVYFHLNPYLVLSHLLLSLVVLGLGVVVALEAVELLVGRASYLVPEIVRWGGLAVLLAAAVLLVSGTFVTASGPHSGGEDVRRLGAFPTAIWLHVRATAVFGVAFLGILGWSWRERRRLPGALRSSLLLTGLLLVQMAIGEVQYRNALPWWLVLIHVTVAAAVWGWAVAVVAMLWRPLAWRTGRARPA
ncbi:MAG: heme A synthase [Gaiellaceae bacterium]